jgi:hypothetical protein
VKTHIRPVIAVIVPYKEADLAPAKILHSGLQPSRSANYPLFASRRNDSYALSQESGYFTAGANFQASEGGL